MQQPAQTNPSPVQTPTVLPTGQVMVPAGVFTVDPGQEARFQQLAQRLAALEQQLQMSNDRLLQSLGEARMVADTNTRIDRLAAVVQQSLLQNRLTLQVLSEMRAALTGPVPSTRGTNNQHPQVPQHQQQPMAPGNMAPNGTSPRQPSAPSQPVQQPSQPVQPSGRGNPAR